MASLAYVEALGHVDRAMKLISTLPAGAERDEWELAFLSIEGPSRMALVLAELSLADLRLEWRRQCRCSTR